jgi:P27 family predicted phage terminase small subunit
MGGHGSGGRNAKPTALKELEGNQGHRKLNHAEPQPDKVAPEMPKGMPKAAQREWKKMERLLLKHGLLTEIDGKALAGYCLCQAIIEEAVREIKARGQYIVTHYQDKHTSEIIVGDVKSNPAVSDLNRALAQQKSFEIEFGLTPASRSKLKVEKPPTVDPLDELLGRSPHVVQFPVAVEKAN